MSYTDADRTLALAGLYQSCWLVQRLALTGAADTTANQASLGSILRLDAEDVPAVFGGPAALRLGLTELNKFLGGRANPDVARYLLTLLRLENVIRPKPELMAELARGIAQVQPLAAAEGVDAAPCVQQFAELYVRHISPLRPRVLVNGEQAHLRNPVTVERVRALLLAGLRAAVLWRQCGGSRWGLWWKQARYLQQTQQLLQQIS